MRPIPRHDLQNGLTRGGVAAFLNTEGSRGDARRPCAWWAVSQAIANIKRAGAYRVGRRRRTFAGARFDGPAVANDGSAGGSTATAWQVSRRRALRLIARL